MKKRTQAEKILTALEAGHVITPLDALHKYGTLRLGARVFDLRKAGHQIMSRRVRIGDKTVAIYFLN